MQEVHGQSGGTENEVKSDTSELHSAIRDLRAEVKLLRKLNQHRETVWKARFDYEKPFAGVKYGGRKAHHASPHMILEYESVEMEVANDDEPQLGIFYKGGQIMLAEIVLRLNRLSALERQNDQISAMVLDWTEKVVEYNECTQDYDRGYVRGVEYCRDGISDIWAEGCKKYVGKAATKRVGK